jgi:hypothetical protein
LTACLIVLIEPLHKTLLTQLELVSIQILIIYCCLQHTIYLNSIGEVLWCECSADVNWMLNDCDY